MAVTVSRDEQMSPLRAFFSSMGYITIMKSNSQPVSFATIMTELFWATEHEQNVLNIACFGIILLKEPGEKTQAPNAELYLYCAEDATR